MAKFEKLKTQGRQKEETSSLLRKSVMAFDVTLNCVVWAKKVPYHNDFYKAVRKNVLGLSNYSFSNEMLPVSTS